MIHGINMADTYFFVTLSLPLPLRTWAWLRRRPQTRGRPFLWVRWPIRSSGSCARVATLIRTSPQCSSSFARRRASRGLPQRVTTDCYACCRFHQTSFLYMCNIGMRRILPV